MKRYLALIIFGALIGKSSLSQYTAIPDVNFEQALIDLGYDSGSPDGLVLTSNINTVITLVVDDYNIFDMTGIEDFNNLQALYCRNNQISNLNVTQNIGLVSLVCDNNLISTLDLMQNSYLKTLVCGNNNLSNLDVTQNLNLIFIQCDSNQITILDVSQNLDLVGLYCDSNLLNNLDVSQNLLLENLRCSNNELSSLDVSENLILSSLICFNNQLTSLDISQNHSLHGLNCSNNYINTLDVSQNSSLFSIDCQSNNLSCLNVKNGQNHNFYKFIASNNPNLICIEVDDPSWSTSVWNNNQIDAGAYFSNYCGNTCTTDVSELDHNKKELVKIVNLMGQEVNSNEAGILMFIYGDGTTEKRIINN
jgi:hypothetical protein